tara:strand:+ start:44 stop:370 length:327 start_codon:yes stop_codon:yes gene_type:complete
MRGRSLEKKTTLLTQIKENQMKFLDLLQKYIDLNVSVAETDITNRIFDALEDLEINTNDFRNIYKNNNRTLSETNYSSSSRESSPITPKNKTRAGKKNKKRNKTKRKF